MDEQEHADVLPDAARYVQPKLSPARVERVWASVSHRLAGRVHPRHVPAFLAVAALTLTLAGGFTWWLGAQEPAPTAESLPAGAVLETAGDVLSMGLLDGSRLTLAQSSRVEVTSSNERSVRLHLTRGRIECDVKPRRGASFVVTTEGVEVRVVGTHFSVSSERDQVSRRVRVEVERGEVEIHSANQPAEVVRLTAGHSWSQETKTGRVIASKPSEPAQNPAPARPAPLEKTPAPAKAKELAAVTAAPAAESSAAESSGAEALAAKSSAAKPSVDVPGARELLEEANQLRRAGNAREAAARYEMLLTQHASDARAGLAAFELGRLRMDRLGDLKGAISAFERAMALAPGSGFREDALARVVTAHARSGNPAGCQAAKVRYLKSYPTGVHREAVLDQCGAR